MNKPIRINHNIYIDRDGDLEVTLDQSGTLYFTKKELEAIIERMETQEHE